MIQGLADTPIGTLGLIVSEGALVRIAFSPLAEIPIGEDRVLSMAKEQLRAYFSGERRCFCLPLMPIGTPFQQRVWSALAEIPYGTTETYGELALRIGAGKAVRAVGQANHRNPLPIVIPCHRVIGRDGSLTGYAGGMEAKRALLRLEGILAEQTRKT